MSNTLSNSRGTANTGLRSLHGAARKTRKQKAKPQPSHLFTPIRSASARKGLCIAIAAIAQALAGHAYAGPDDGSTF